MEKISVIVPIHNNEQYLERCLCSITRQTYSTLEIILIDDGSTDQSLEICYDFKEQDNRIKVISTKQHGVGATRNLGLKNATGYYVAFVDSDDYICADMFEYLYSLLKQHNADIAICGYKEVDDNDAVIKVCNADKEQSYTSSEAIRELAKDNVMKSYLWNKLFKHSLFKNIKFPENLMFGEDLCTTYKLFLNAKLISCGNQIKYFYVKHSGSITNQDKYRWQSLYSLELFKNAISPYLEDSDLILGPRIIDRAIFVDINTEKLANSEQNSIKTIYKQYYTYASAKQKIYIHLRMIFKSIIKLRSLCQKEN